MRALERELPVQILPDGGHRIAQPVGAAAGAAGSDRHRARHCAPAQVEVPAALQEAIERMAPMLRFFRHGDRRLALFNNSVEEDGVLVDLVLTRSETQGPRAERRRRIPAFSACRPGRASFSSIPASRRRAASTTRRMPAPLSFELSQGRERIIVNCGGYRGPKPDWWRVARASAAHSVLVVADTNSVEIRADGTLGRGPTSVRCERAEEDGQQWIVRDA